MKLMKLIDEEIDQALETNGGDTSVRMVLEGVRRRIEPLYAESGTGLSEGDVTAIISDRFRMRAERDDLEIERLLPDSSQGIERGLDTERLRAKPKALPPWATKDALLEQYARCEPRKFYRLDGFYRHLPCDPPPGDDVVVFGGETYELMGHADVTILVSAETSNKDVERLLKKLLSRVNDGALDERSRAFAREERAAACPDDLPF
jgi:hypothetical protein